jgi:dethiobiotin synthase
MSRPGLAVVGTDTEIGKTVVSALVVARYAPEHPLSYWKPVASGADTDERDTETVRWLTGAESGDPAGRPAGPVEILPEEYLFGRPLSPHLAARLEGRRVEPERLLERYRQLRRREEGRTLVVEGVGGLLVPLTETGAGDDGAAAAGLLLIDLLPALDLACLLVARSTLGTINHSLLSLEALRDRGVEVAGVVLVGPPNLENRRAVERFGRAEVIGELPPLDPLSPETLQEAARGFDPEGRLRGYLTRDEGRQKA